ncbi:hypothetical protein [Neglectibacter caecimuris]|uniref:hypothetical protein n=1 Tax=Neglectibacter caecimuris TaxID=3093658 RepID=UPI002AC8E45A|nr:hypothetical protein [Neglectibacter sp. M00184]
MKKNLFLCLAAALLLTAAGCGDDEPFSAGPAASGSKLSAGVSEVSAAPSEPPVAHEAEPVPDPTPRPEAVAGDGGELDLLSSSPYYSGQEALLRDICHVSTRKPPESFYWLNEEAVRAAWGIDGYISACCQDFVAGFDFDRPGENGQQERFFVFIAMFPEVEIPETDRDGRVCYTPAEEWAAVEGRPGFEARKVEAALLPPSQKDPQAEWLTAAETASSGSSPLEPAPAPLPAVVRVRFQLDDFWVMLQLPESALEGFWENTGSLFQQVDAQNIEKPIYMSSNAAAFAASSEGE